MLEFVVTIPFLAMLIAGVFFLGWVVRSENKLLVAARYGAWRNAANTRAGTDATKEAWTLYGEPDEQDMRDDFIDKYQQYNKQTVDSARLNERFYGNEVATNTFKTDVGSDTVLQDFVKDAFLLHIDAGDLAEESVLDRFPYGSGFTVTATFDHDRTAWYKFTSGETDMTRRAFRDGVSWRRYQVSYLEPVRDLFLADFDMNMRTVQPAELQTNLRNLYLQDW